MFDLRSDGWTKNGWMKRWDRRADGDGFRNRCADSGTGAGNKRKAFRLTPGTGIRVDYFCLFGLLAWLIAGFDPFALRVVLGSKPHNDEGSVLRRSDCCPDGQDGQL